MRRLLSRIVRCWQGKLEEGNLGPHLTELIWRKRHLYKKKWAEGYLDTTDHPHRIQIVEAVVEFHPISVVLEVGCASGANLICLRSRLPQVRLIGIDINPHAIEVAKRHFSNQRDFDTSFMISRADRMIGIPDASVDVVITDAVLMFIPPKKINKVMAEVFRVARRGLLLNEYSLPSGGKKSHFEGGRWVHDLPSIVQNVRPGAQLTVCASYFKGGAWEKFGRFIKVRW